MIKDNPEPFLQKDEYPHSRANRRAAAERQDDDMITIKEIAQECGVSATTVSNVLNGKSKVGEEKRRQILDVIRPGGIATAGRCHRGEGHRDMR